MDLHVFLVQLALLKARELAQGHLGGKLAVHHATSVETGCVGQGRERGSRFQEHIGDVSTWERFRAGRASKNACPPEASSPGLVVIDLTFFM